MSTFSVNSIFSIIRYCKLIELFLYIPNLDIFDDILKFEYIGKVDILGVLDVYDILL